MESDILKSKIGKQIDEWEHYEKRFPHKETKWNRLKNRIFKIIDKSAELNRKQKVKK